MERTRDVITHQALRVALTANVVLAASKIAVGVMVASPALLADGINSATDVAYTIAARHFVVRASEPPDDDHPYGHGQLESIATLSVGAFVMATAIALVIGGINDVVRIFVDGPTLSDTSLVALSIALATVIIKIVLWLVTTKQADQSKSLIVSALAKDHRNDILSGGAAATGIFMARLGHAWADPAAAILVSVIIFRTGYEILGEAADDLMNVQPTGDFAAEVAKVAQSIPGVERVEITNTHRYGIAFVATLTIGVDASLSVRDGHELADTVERRLVEQLADLRAVDVHVEPT